MAGKVTNGMVSIDKPILTEEYGFLCRSQRSAICLKVESSKSSNEHLSNTRLFLSSRGFQHIIVKPYSYTIFKRHGVSCHSNGREVKEYMRKSRDCTELSSSQLENEHARGTGRHSCDRQAMPGSETTYSNRGIAEACKFAYNDAKFVNERARNDFVLLSRSISKLNNRAREDVAVLGLGFLKLDARAKEDSEIIDHGVKQAAHIHHIVTGKAQSKLKKVADQHWSDGALETDLRRADFCFKRRAMEDAFMALKFVKRIHELMATNMDKQSQKQGSFSVNDMMGFVTLEKNGKALDLLAQEVTTGRISAIQDAYWSMASALSEADGIDYTDPEELELLVATLIDLDAMDGKKSVSLLVECSCSPDVSTRQALANALASAPSIWILGNAGMGALQRLSEDSNPAVAAAASKAISELKQQWELEEGDSLRFMMNQHSKPDDDDDDDL